MHSAYFRRAAAVADESARVEDGKDRKGREGNGNVKEGKRTYPSPLTAGMKPSHFAQRWVPETGLPVQPASMHGHTSAFLFMEEAAVPGPQRDRVAYLVVHHFGPRMLACRLPPQLGRQGGF